MASPGKWLHRGASFAGLALLGGAAFFLWHALKHLDFDKALAHLTHTADWQLAAAAGLTVLGYAIVYGYDRVALMYARARPLGRGRVMFASFVSGAISNSFGIPIIGLSGMRFRFFAEWGLSGFQIVQEFAFVGACAWLGLMFLTGITVTVWPPAVPWADRAALRGLGAALLFAVIGYIVVCGWRRQVRLWRWSIRVPTRRVAVVQVLLGVADWLAQAGIFYALIPTSEQVPVGWFLACFTLAMLASMIGHAPAGLGVFDSGVLLLMGSRISAESLVDVLILFRLFYHVTPLVLAMAMLLGFEVRQRLRAAPVVNAPKPDSGSAPDTELHGGSP